LSPLALQGSLLLIAFLAVRSTVELILFDLVLVAFVSITTAIAALMANSLELRDDALVVQTNIGRWVVLPWNAVSSVTWVDRADLALPRFLLRVRGGGREVFITNSIGSWETLVGEISKRAPQAATRPMSRLERLLLLQWGA